MPTPGPTNTTLPSPIDDQSGAPQVAIIGRPNVGKSALFNRLIGRRVAIVHDQPGITRDRIFGTCSRGGRPFVVWDTGGITGAGESQLTGEVQEVVRQAMRESDVLLLVVDAKTGLSPIDEEISRTLRRSGKPIVLVVNKVDTENHEDLAFDFLSLGIGPMISVSAEHGRGISELLSVVQELLPSSASHHQTTGDAAKPLLVAIVGRPNVGKSSFINAILRRKHAIVSELAGTTRDAVDIFYERGRDRYVFIDTAGIRRRGAHSSSVEVFSVKRAERSIRRADLCVLILDVTSGVTAQDKRIAGLIQDAGRACIVILNKWDLIKTTSRQRHGGDDSKKALRHIIDQTRAELFFLPYAPIAITSALTGESVDRVFGLIQQIRGGAGKRIGTGVLNRRLRDAFAANPPPMSRGHRLKLFYAAQPIGRAESVLERPQFVLFVNDPRLITQHYQRYLEGRIREAQPYIGCPIILTLRPRRETVTRASRSRSK